MKLVYMCRPEFENGGGELRERPFTENWGGGRSELPLTKKKGGDIGTKNNKETYNFKRVYFGAFQVGKMEQMYIFEKGGFRSGPGRNSGVFRSGPNMGVPGPRELPYSYAL